MGRKPGTPATPAQREALRKGQEKRREMLKKGGESASTRWSRLLDGTLSVQDLSDDEINNMKVKGLGGSSSRRKRMPSHIAQAFSDERMRRAKEGIAQLLPQALDAYSDILNDTEEPAQRAKVAKDVIDRVVGKAPDTVRITQDSPFEIAVREAAVSRSVEELEALANGE